MRRLLLSALGMTVVMTVLLGLAYPLLVTGVAQVAFHGQANGSLVTGPTGQVVGSGLIGQSFSTKDGKPILRYFQPRPSAAGAGYDAMASGGSNLGPTNPALLQAVAAAEKAYRSLNGVPASVTIPIDAVTTSGSGLDPQISIANAELQAPRVARVRGLPLATVERLISRATITRVLGSLGEPGVNVLELNVALDRLTRS